KFDYVNKSLSVEPASAYDTKLVPGAYLLPVTFDDGLAYFKGTIGTHESENLLLDNSFDYSYVFGNFTAKYPDAVPDTEGKKHETATIPFADSNGYGRDVELWVANLPEVFFGPAHFKNFHMFATNADFDFGGGFGGCGDGHGLAAILRRLHGLRTQPRLFKTERLVLQELQGGAIVLRAGLFAGALIATVVLAFSPVYADDAASLTAPPAGITPSSKTLREVMLEHRRAVKPVEALKTVNEKASGVR
ncbi:MAG: hypothetical protein JO165_05060, partial [Candidatus Eremiobacteraeota bacterium]|nr:hypothetical protein [Candidatus Eremiobacteraeota bacterium]